MSERDNLERAILCACLQDPETVPVLADYGLTQQDFADAKHQVIWRAALALRGRGRQTDILTLSAFLREHNVTHRVGGEEYLGNLLSEVILPLPMFNRALGWCEALRDLARQAVDADGTGQRHQVESARGMLGRDVRSMLTYPIKTLADLRGGWAPGEVDFLAAASNSGKTTLLSTIARKWVAQGRKVYYAGFELPAAALRLQWAAHEAGFLPGDVVSGEYLHWPNVDDVRARVEYALRQQDERVNLLRCADANFVDTKSIQQMGEDAARWGADVVIIDHIDHVSGNGDLHGQSRQVVSAVLEMGKATGVRYLIATQLNQQGLAQDMLRSHRPVREEYIKQGGHKKEVATFMMGLSRALRRNVTKEELKKVRDRVAEVQTIEEPYASQVNVMKHRWYGDRVGRVRLLSWERGEYTDYLSGEDRKVGRILTRADQGHVLQVANG